MNEVNNIPEGWVEMTLGDVMRISSGKARPKTFGKYPVYGGNGILGRPNSNSISSSACLDVLTPSDFKGFASK